MDMTTKLIVKALGELQNEVKHVRKDIDLLKGMLLDDALLTKEERIHLDETMRLLKEGKTGEFVRVV